MLPFFPFLAVLLDSGEDEVLIRRLKERDASALGEVYDRYGRATFGLILRIVRQHEVAQDLTQETFLRVWNKVPSYDIARGTLYTWVLTIARHLAIDYIRSRAGRTRMAPLEDIERIFFVEGTAGVEARLNSRLLKTALDKLEPKYRTLIEMAYYDGLSQTEMADKLQVPLGTIKTWVRSALRLLREDLAENIA
jgi:RNA polymerase sigma-70 factor (ECF subfamily)